MLPFNAYSSFKETHLYQIENTDEESSKCEVPVAMVITDPISATAIIGSKTEKESLPFCL